MATIEEVARAALAAVDCDASYVLAAQWAAERYQQLCSKMRLRNMRELGRVTVPAAYVTGTIAVVRGATTVTGTDTAWTADLVGRFLRVRTNWYKVLQVATSTAIVIDQPYSEEDVSAVTYAIVQRQVALDPQARWIGNEMVHQRLRKPLTKMSLAEMDRYFPDRILQGSVMDAWCQTQDVLNSAGQSCLAIEAYPYPTQAELLCYVLWKVPPLLKPEDYLPHNIDAYQLKEGTLINVMQYNASQCANPASPRFDINAAGYWRNEFRQQSTTWERVMLDVGKQDKGVDDMTFILDTLGGARWHGEIRTAHDEIYARGRRP